MLRDEEKCYPFSITVRDRFGDFGLINLVILRRVEDALEIDTFVMSCRVLQRGVEQLAMNRVFEHARRAGCRRVVGCYIPTAKNVMVKDFYERFGFAPIEARDGQGSWYALDVADYLPREVYIREVSSFP